MNKLLFFVAVLSVCAAIGSSFYFDSSSSVVLLDAPNNADTQKIPYKQARADLQKTLSSPTLDRQLKQELSELLAETDEAMITVEELEANLNQAESEQAIADLESSLRAEYEKAGLDYDLAYKQAQKTITAEPTDAEVQNLIKDFKEGSNNE